MFSQIDLARLRDIQKIHPRIHGKKRRKLYPKTTGSNPKSKRAQHHISEALLLKRWMDDEKMTSQGSAAGQAEEAAKISMTMLNCPQKTKSHNKHKIAHKEEFHGICFDRFAMFRFPICLPASAFPGASRLAGLWRAVGLERSMASNSLALVCAWLRGRMGSSQSLNRKELCLLPTRQRGQQ